MSLERDSDGTVLAGKGNLLWQTLKTSCHYVTIQSDPVKKITMNRIWPHDHAATEVWDSWVHVKNWVFMCLPVCQFTAATSYQKKYFSVKIRIKLFFLTIVFLILSVANTHAHLYTHAHTNTHCFLFPYACSHSISAAQQPISNKHANEVGVSF